MKTKIYPFMFAMAIAAARNNYYDTGESHRHSEDTKRDLPRWDVGGNIIFAKDEKTAIKYAKKRGLWYPGCFAKLLND